MAGSGVRQGFGVAVESGFRAAVECAKEPAMPEADSETRWNELAAEVLTGFRAWRAQHPTASLTEIEDELDRRWYRLRARVVEDAALRSAAADPATAARPACPACGQAMRAGGRKVRRLTTTGDEVLTLTRSHARCPACGTGLFPPG
jgi:YgiT-type zinc finger domain-containing protein